MRFKPLHIPDTWKHYWTKYPEGYTILESLMDWVSQVNDMTVNVSDWNTYLDGFVKQFDKELQNTVDTTLDRWQESGFLDEIITHVLNTEIDELRESTNTAIYKANNPLDQIGNNTIPSSKLSQATDGDKIQMANLSEGVRSAITGQTPVGTTPADGSVTIPKYADGSIIATKLHRGYRYKKHLNSGEDLNIILDDGLYYVSNAVNKPKNFPTGEMEVSRTLDRWVFQRITLHSDPSVMYIRRVDADTGEKTDWKRSTSINDITKLPYLGETDDLNNYTEDNGQWVAIYSKNSPDTSRAWLFENKQYKTSATNRWIEQTAIESNVSSAFVMYKRRASWVGSDSKYKFEPWKLVFHEGQSDVHLLTGSKIVNLGDSIFGNTRGTNSVSNFIALKTGADVYNIGFGGSRIAQHVNYWDAFSLYRLADEIIKDDSDPTKWKLQDEAIDANVNGMPSYFAQHLEDLKGLDWKTIDFLTIAGGTNDYTASVVLDNEANPMDTTTFAGSLRYSLEKIMGKHKHLKVLLCTPMYRFWRDEEGNFIDDSDERSYDGQTLPDFVEIEKIVAREYKTPVIDNYYELGINKFNKEHYFPTNDGTHPNANGNKKLGQKIASALISKF